MGAEYYPLLAKAVGSLPNSTPDTRRVVYERARKALIGQLRTYHPPVPDEDIERESVALDRAIERLEGEIAAKPAAPPADAPPAPVEPPAPKPATSKTAPPKPATSKPATSKPASSKSVPSDGEPGTPMPPPLAPRPSVSGALGPSAPRKPLPPLRPRAPKASEPIEPTPTAVDTQTTAPIPPQEAESASEPKPPALRPSIAPAPPAGELKLPSSKPEVTAPLPPSARDAEMADAVPRPRLEAQRPFAPQPAVAKGPKRRIWIIPLVIAIVAVPVAYAAWKLRVTPETIAHNSHPAQTAPQDNGKIADRVGGTKNDDSQAPEPPAAPTPQEAAQQPQQPQAAAPASQPAQPEQAAQPPAQPAQQDAANPAPAAAPAASNPELPIAYRAALLVEAPDLPSKVQTFAGTVVWKLNNANTGPGDAATLSVEADIDLPDDKLKATVIFEKNTDASLPASHTIKVRFTPDQGSYSGDVKQINVLQMRREGNSDGEPLAGVTVPIVQNSFLVGLSPGNAETANLRLLSDLPWVDIPILLNSGKIAKLTFEKGAAGQRDISEAATYWQKQ